MDRMRALEPEFCTLPSQAVCCSLYNYTTVHSKQDMKEFITNYVFADITGTDTDEFNVKNLRAGNFFAEYLAVLASILIRCI